MSPLVMLSIAVITYGSRVAALVLLPRPGPRLEAILGRIPAPIFASLATATLLSDGSLTVSPTLWAAVGALVLSPARSLLLCLIGGAAGYAVSALLG